MIKYERLDTPSEMLCPTLTITSDLTKFFCIKLWCSFPCINGLSHMEEMKFILHDDNYLIIYHCKNFHYLKSEFAKTHHWGSCLKSPPPLCPPTHTEHKQQPLCGFMDLKTILEKMEHKINLIELGQ